MQLVSNDSRKDEDLSESQPILSGSEDSSPSSCEITTLRGGGGGGDCVVDVDDPRASALVDETCQLVINSDHPQCRICLDSGGEDLIAPCHCKGTQKYVHRSCLDNWRSTKEGFAFAHCTECRAVFILRANVPSDRWWLRLKFQFLVARDHAFIFITVQLVVAFLGVLVYKFYGEELREMFGYEEHPYGFYTMAVLAIVLVGLLYGFFIAIICGQRINERHYHVLAKQELTKEYVVEDREHSKNVSELDPSHVTELRMLGLY
ncbi:RING/FYVE/PHD zinc finger superfamily protein isoform 2 [Tripterygium wilfordii]|uniref:RING/FYVE/PHD zinc finger superfamily protein isoform 2 n=1 Tax=Tripterygium wilfordii TaxID=458696 RepID=A0A7J7CZ37_TRIWF|nr:E3 ubiquitin-protein ligase MARCHF2 [Tripterygium wilfordii]XP_038718132.1 E3 ubiquitin-protein ligase MARCHF2 [Tripterygium wilfordii]XP_038718133.1 E3 ubiquitin-protein ligase MARCHF2 [Tripterygium wilfordii]XP_038718134.1 E3 ubiquitin-protein ligase MARCHF2 [Tripterygium wilfordii]KAF5739229.1 RING/FYVE/PHD zinc finger superfamily protein isoform 2 [Tripterygium wilfordii]